MMYNPDIETLPLEKLRKLQSQRLQELLQRVRKVPFYKNSFEEKGIDLSAIKGVEDLHLLPFTHKSNLRDHYPFGLFSVPMDEVIRIHASSGTTGKPTVVGYNQHDLEIFDEVVARSLVCGGARPGMKLHNAYGYGLFTGGLGMHGGATKLGMTVIPISGGMTDRQIMLLKDFQSEVICCTPSYAMALGEEMRNKGITLDELNIKYGILGAEPWTESIRADVEKLMGVNATNIYGLSEIIGPGVSQEDYEEKGSGSYIWEDHFYPEVVDKDTGEPLPYGKEGVLVFTTLTKQALPVIRYWTNDICSIHYDSDAKRTHIKMSMIKGRSDDMLVIKGVNLFPTQIEVLLEQFDTLSTNYRITLDREGPKDMVLLEVEATDKITSELSEEFQFASVIQQAKSTLTHKIKDNIGLNVQVKIKKHNTIPRSQGGKLNRVLDRRK